MNNNWVKVEEEKPEPWEIVLAYWSDAPGYGFIGNMEVCCWSGDEEPVGWAMLSDFATADVFPEDPTHWMQLPDPPDVP